ncbi:helix-turn-helix domain-containing protein [Bifidobacterium sp. ESL0704]|uniref:ArsR/SmtB family transcription factor n=1 Tax=Bifidobacterium sp. ESL0704 TaxID=2983219 RepID=UPI0023F6FA4B|nr:helix-turn-helix domain-containing protein [Bifidobacterium sp. ESL0704]WEV52238.1 helix-turn-helix domain-containing protein [Bifidobacterium sp. ESL0704]
MRQNPAPPATLDLAVVLHALADPVRLAVVSQIASAPDDVACGSFDVPVTKSTLSHHFKILREAGVIETRRDGIRSLNTLRRAALDKAFPGLLDAILAAQDKTH